ncbi:MAG TPA: hypothetical protein VF260_11060 [Bacilli bacterium]
MLASFKQGANPLVWGVYVLAFLNGLLIWAVAGKMQNIAIGWGVDATFDRTMQENKKFRLPIAPTGLAYDKATPDEIKHLRKNGWIASLHKAKAANHLPGMMLKRVNHLPAHR